jgi:hypothetical protein
MLNAGWTQFGIGLLDMHDVWGPPCPPGPVLKYIPGVIDTIAFMGWPGGFATHKHADKVIVEGKPVVQQAHDTGYFNIHIPFIASPPNMMQFVIHNILSKHKVMFPITKVVVENKPMGTYLARLGGCICSNPITLPSGFLVPTVGTVHAGMTLKDIILGFAFIAVDLIIDILWSKIMKSDSWRTANSKNWPRYANKSFPPSYIPVQPRQFPLGPVRNAFNKVVDKGASALPSVGWYKGSLDAMFNSGNPFRAVGLAQQLGQKLFDHGMKSWIASPLIAGTVFQITAGLSPSVDSREVPSVAIGRAGLHLKLVPWGGVRGNVVN